VKAIEECKTSKKSWISFSHCCEKMLSNDKLKNDELQAWAKNTLTGYLNALVYNLSKSKFYISKILLLLITHNSEEMKAVFDAEFPWL